MYIFLGILLGLLAVGYGSIIIPFVEKKLIEFRFKCMINKSSWCCCKGDFVRSKECGGDCETCKHFVSLEDLK